MGVLFQQRRDPGESPARAKQNGQLQPPGSQFSDFAQRERDDQSDPTAQERRVRDYR
jgi:hypothetical protein